MDESIAELFKRTSLRPSTQRGYACGILNFCGNIQPKEMVEIFRNDPARGKQALENWILGQKGKLLRSSLDFYFAAIREWLWANKAKLPGDDWADILEVKRKAFRNHRTREAILTREDLIRILEAHTKNAREKWFLTGLTSSGIRIAAFLGLKFHHFKDDLNKELNSYQIDVPPELDKAGNGYTTFITPQARNFLLAHKCEREARGEVIAADSYCFGKKKSRWGNGAIQYPSVNALFRRVFKAAGISTVVSEKTFGERTVRRYDSRIHLLRKFFKSMFTRGGVDPIFSETLSGRSLEKFGVGASIYEQAVHDVVFLRGQYERAVPYLTLSGEAEKMVGVSSRVSELEAQLEAMKVELNKRIWDMTEPIVKQRIDELMVSLGINQKGA